MTKKQATTNLVKDIITAIAAIAVIAAITVMWMELDIFGGIVIGFLLAGIPFGWRWLSKVFTALGFLTIVAKFFGAILLGWLALPIILIKDIIQLAVAAKDEKNGTVSAEIIEQ